MSALVVVDGAASQLHFVARRRRVFELMIGRAVDTSPPCTLDLSWQAFFPTFLHIDLTNVCILTIDIYKQGRRFAPILAWERARV